jgi:hypothetical protein
MKHFFKKRTIKEQSTPFKELSFSAKIEYIWGYYKYFILAAAIAVCVVVSFVIAYRRNDYDTECTFVIVDGKMTGYDSQTDAITTGFTAYLGLDGKKKRIVCDYNYSLIPQLLDNEASVSQDKIYILASTGSMDGYIASRDYIDYFSTDREVFLTDLREILTDSEFQTLEAKNAIVYYTKDDGTKIPIAVDLSDTKIKTGTDFTMENPCYGIVVTSPNLENAAAFIRYAFDL